jgi:hypothetical protein
MASTTIKMKRNDTQPFLDIKLKDNSSDYADLTVSGLAVTFTMKDSETDVVKVDSQPCQIISGIIGSVRYPWSIGDTDTAGAYLAEFEVTSPAIPPYPEYKLTYPVEGTLVIVILEDYDAD